MPRIARALADNQIYHIVNRGNRRESVFHDTYDFEKFLGFKTLYIDTIKNLGSNQWIKQRYSSF